MVSQASYNLSQFSDGIWYFFVSFNSGSAWSPPVMEKFMLDRTPPEPFVISRVDTNQADIQPVFAWSANDDTSGVDHDEVKIGNGDWFNASTIQSGSSSYSFRRSRRPARGRSPSVRLTGREVYRRVARFWHLPLFALNTPVSQDRLFCGLSALFSEWGWAIAASLSFSFSLPTGSSTICSLEEALKRTEKIRG